MLNVCRDLKSLKEEVVYAEWDRWRLSLTSRLLQIVLNAINSSSDDHGTDESMIVLEELEKIDDDCDKHGIQFVKIDDPSAAREYGIEHIPAIVYFEKQVPNVFDGDLQDEDQILQWLVEQLEKDEIEDVTDEMLDKMVKEGKMLAVLFCEYLRQIAQEPFQKCPLILQFDLLR